MLIVRIAAVLAFCATNLFGVPADYFAIHVVDDQTGRGIPLVELHTTYKANYYTDSNGYIAFMEPGLMGQTIWFDIASAGYESPSGPLGMKGMSFVATPGASVEVKLKRNNIAERLYRMTGYGQYRDTVLLGKVPPIKQPLLNSLVCGSDTVQVVVFKKRYLWFWQDTDQLGFRLGNFSMTGAVASGLPEDQDLNAGIEFEYFTGDNRFARAMADVKVEGSHPIWIDGLSNVKDEHGNEQLLARYAAVNGDMSLHEEGLVLWNEKREIFEVLKKFDRIGTPGPGGRPTRVRVGDEEFLYFPSPYAHVRVKANFASASDPSSYEVLTCLKPGIAVAKAAGDFNRDANGKLIWTWQHNAKPARLADVEEWLKSKLITREETPFQMRDVDTGKPITVAGGSIAWNPFLKKWTMLFGQQFGDSVLGELWFAVANSPEGPWRDAKKVATHAKPNDHNDCYNPIQHDELMREGGRVIFFEGTFVNTFSGNPKQTPYYDYNNLMYRLDLADPRMKLPEPPAGLSEAKPSE